MNIPIHEIKNYIGTGLKGYTIDGKFDSWHKSPRLTLEEWHPLDGKPFPKLPELRVNVWFKALGTWEIGYKIGDTTYNQFGDKLISNIETRPVIDGIYPPFND